MAALLLVKDGSYQATFYLSASTMIGRDPNCDICLESDAISARHALLSSQGDTFTIHDIGSFNGTMVNGAKVKTATINHQDIIMVADTMLIFDATINRNSGSQPITVVKMPQATLRNASVAPEHLQRQPLATIERMKLLSQPIPQVKQAAKIQHRTAASMPRSKMPSAAAMEVIEAEKQKKLLDNTIKAGWWSPIAFPVTIVMSHIAHPRTDKEKKAVNIAMALGYGFLFFWAVLYFTLREDPDLVAERESLARAKTSAISVNDPNRFLNGPFAWAPQGLTYDDLSKSFQESFNGYGSSSSRTAYMDVWKNGVVVLPVKSVVSVFKEEARTLKVTLEDCRSQTGPGFNMFMVPQRRCLVKGFYIPSLNEKDLTVELDESLPPQRDRSNRSFPWSQQAQVLNIHATEAVQGIIQSGKDLHVLFLLVPGGAPPVTIAINTVNTPPASPEKRLARTAVIPSGLLGYILYVEGSQRPLMTVINNYAGSAEDATEMLGILLGMKPGSDQLPKVFKLADYKVAKPAPPPPAPEPEPVAPSAPPGLVPVTQPAQPQLPPINPAVQMPVHQPPQPVMPSAPVEPGPILMPSDLPMQMPGSSTP